MRIHPETGEILFGYSPTSASVRGFAVDSSGTAVVATYSTGFPSGIQTLQVLSGAYEDRNFNSIRSLNRPLGYLYGGRQSGSTTTTSNITLNPTLMTVMCNTFSAGLNVDLVNPSTFGQTDWRCTVGDNFGNAATNNITVAGGGYSIEDPNNLGTLNLVVPIRTNFQVVTWVFIPGASAWYVESINNGGSGGGGGLTLENNGSAISGNPHTTLNFQGDIQATDAGSGVANISVSGIIGGYVLVGNANPSTGTLDASHLQAIVDTSAGLTTVNAPDATAPSIQTTFRVTDDTATAASNPITIQSQSSRNIEDPNNHGHYATSVQITVNSQSIDWQWTGSHWKIV
jgi:hypothetical protein